MHKSVPALALLLALLLTLLPGAGVASSIRYEAPPETLAKGEGLEVCFLGIGLGDCFFLSCGGETILIDGGVKLASPYIAKFLDARGLKGVDIMLNTHAHDDHIGGLTSLMHRGYAPRKVMSPYSFEYKMPLHRAFVKKAREMGAAYARIDDGDSFALGDARFDVIRNTTPGVGANAASVILRVTYGKRSLLLLADAAGVTGHWLMKNRADMLRADIVKCMHHGLNRFVPGLIELIDPELAIITNRRSNKPLAAQQFAEHDIPMLFTPMGTITARTDGESWYVQQENAGAEAPGV